MGICDILSFWVCLEIVISYEKENFIKRGEEPLNFESASFRAQVHDGNA